jgi:hypothetical protein
MVFVMCFAVLSTSFSSITAQAYGETLIIDPGHGGSDPGACAFGREEAYDVLRLSLRVGEIIGGACSLTYTRTTDATLSLNDRCVIANNNRNSFFCSIHRNAGGGTGVETYYCTGGSAKSAAMAEAVNSRLANAVPWRNRGVKTQLYYVIRYTNMPAILTEVGFIDTARDNELFDQYFDAIAYSIAEGLGAVIGFTPNGSGKKTTWRDDVAFDPMVYRDKHEDLKDMNDEQLKNHWNEYGIKEGRCASTVLDLKYYVENNEDLKAAFGEDYAAAYEHFCEYGYKEHRVSSRVFDGRYYCDNHHDVAEIYGDEYIRHYIDHGMKEGRRASKTFDVNYYLFTRPDVAEMWQGDLAMATRHYAGHGVKEGKPGYDSTDPVFENVVISDISSKGYTVTATVTDDWGIDRVCFPTWSIKNHQDDLKEDWYDLCLGTKNGNTYTFVVKTSEHNNETGLYSTHIYAYDLGGNRFGVAYDDIDVKDEPSEIILKGESSYVKDGASLKNVKPSTTVDSLLSQFENADLKVVGEDGNSITASQNVGTGDKIQLYKNGEIVDALTVIILGDIDGNGVIDSTDYIRVKANFLGTFSLDSNQKIAADVDLSDKIDSTDYMRIKGHFVNTFVIG